MSKFDSRIRALEIQANQHKKAQVIDIICELHSAALNFLLIMSTLVKPISTISEMCVNEYFMTEKKTSNSDHFQESNLICSRFCIIALLSCSNHLIQCIDLYFNSPKFN